VCMGYAGLGGRSHLHTPTHPGDDRLRSTVRAPICFDPLASRTVLPYHELRAKLAMEGKDADAIASGVAMAYALGQMAKREEVAFTYMWSADMNLGPGAGDWHPHMMIYAPYCDNSWLGGNELGGLAPVAGDDAGTPFAVVVIPLHGIQAFTAKTAAQNQRSRQALYRAAG
jgi:hypothetical protein